MSGCKSCAHWDRDIANRHYYVRDSIPHGPGYKIDWSASEAVRKDQQQRLDARVAELQGHYGVCDGLPLGADPEDEPPIAFTIDASAYYSALVTREDFSCVLFEPKVEVRTQEDLS